MIRREANDRKKASSQKFELEKLPSPFIETWFEDDRWKVRVPSLGTEHSISWRNYSLRDGSNLTDSRHQNLLLGMKTFLYFRATGALDLKPIRGTTISNESILLLQLIRWMNEKGLKSFAELTYARVLSYRNYVARREPKPNNKKAIKSRVTLSTRSQNSLVGVIKRLALLQDVMGRYATSFSHSEKLAISDIFINQPDMNETRAIPDNVFADIMSATVAWIKDESPKVLTLLAAVDEYRRVVRASKRKFQASRLAYEKIVAPFISGVKICYEGTERDLLSLTRFERDKLISLARGACLIAIAGLTGMRIGEIASLKEGCLKKRRLANGLNILLLTSTLYKTVRHGDGQAAEWVAGYDDQDNPLTQVISLLHGLPRVGSQQFLFTRMRTNPSSRDRLRHSNLTDSLRDFLAMINVSETDIHSHQFRKTFARFVALSSEASAFTLMRHFKHVSVLMTEHYMMFDTEQINDIFEASQSLKSERLDQIFGAERLGGIGGQQIISKNAAYRGDANAEARRQLVEMTMRDPSSHFRLSPHGICIYEERQARCNGKNEKVGLETCVGCSNYTVSRHNLPYWQSLLQTLHNAQKEQSSYGFISLELQKQITEATDMIRRITGRNGSPA